MSKTYPMQVGLMIAVPLTGRALPPYFTWAFTSLHPPMNYSIRYATNFDAQHKVIQGGVAELRNWYISEAIKQEAKYLFFLDEDVTPPGDALRQLIFQAEHHPEGAWFAGVYCHKGEPHAPMIFKGNGRGPYWDWKVGEFFEVSGSGLGCTLLRVDALKAIEQPWCKTVDDASAFRDGVNSAEQWTEDLYLAEKLTEAGWKLYVDSSVLADHWDMSLFVPARLPLNSKPVQRAQLPEGGLRIVDLGCGETKYETDEGSVVGVDIRDECNPDYRCDLRSLPFATASFDIVYSSHVLEHFPRDEVDAVLDEWLRILKPDGEVRFNLPNIQWAAERIAEGTLNDDVLNVLYGAQGHETNFHKVGFTPESVKRMFEKRGFEVEIEFRGYNMYITARRNNGSAS